MNQPVHTLFTNSTKKITKTGKKSNNKKSQQKPKQLQTYTKNKSTTAKTAKMNKHHSL